MRCFLASIMLIAFGMGAALMVNIFLYGVVPKDDYASYDYIIVGGGPAGSVIVRNVCMCVCVV